MAATGGPDYFGYTWADQDDGPVYAWIDVSEVEDAIPVPLADNDQSGALEIGFDFTFYGEVFTEAWVHSDGFISFADLADIHPGSPGTLCPLPLDDDIEGAIYAWKRDFNPEEGGTIHAATIGEEGSRMFVVQWTDVPIFTQAGGNIDPMSVEITLHEGTNDVTVQIANAGEEMGGDGMAGIESPDGQSGINYAACLSPGSLVDETVVHFTYPTSAFATVPHQRIGAGEPGHDVKHAFTLYNRTDADVVVPIEIAGNTWETTTDPADQVTVPANGSAELQLTSSIADDAAPGDVDVATITLNGPEAIELTTLTGVQRPSQGPWQLVAPLPVANEAMAVTTTDEVIWSAGGLQVEDQQRVPSDLLFRYDVATNEWDTSNGGGVEALPEGRAYAAACVLEDKLYVVGGLTPQVENDRYVLGETTYVYDVASSSWSEGQALLEPRAGAATICDPASGHVFLLGGFTDDGDDPDDLGDDVLVVEQYDPDADEWTVDGGELTAPRSGFAAVLTGDGTAVLAGGSYDGTISTVVEEYDLVGTFTALPPLPVGRSYPVGGILDGEVCVASGGTAVGWAKDWLCLAEEAWIPQIDQLAVPLLLAGGGVADGRLYVLGGQNYQGQPANTVERWPFAELPEADGDSDADSDADSDGDTDADSDGDGDGDGDEDDDGDDGGGCCTVAPGTSSHDRTALVSLGLFAAIAALRRRSRP